jgi:hypothetical protein
MPPKKFVPDPEFFSDPDGLCSLALAKKAGIRYGEPPDDTELIPLVWPRPRLHFPTSVAAQHLFDLCEAQSWVLVNHVFCRLSPNPA